MEGHIMKLQMILFYSKVVHPDQNSPPRPKKLKIKTQHPKPGVLKVNIKCNCINYWFISNIYWL